MTAAQVRYWLEEKHQLDANDRMVRLFVSDLRERYGITRESEPRREYELFNLYAKRKSRKSCITLNTNNKFDILCLNGYNGARYE